MYFIFITNSKKECIDIIYLKGCTRETAFEILNNEQNKNEHCGNRFEYLITDQDNNTVFQSFM